MLKMETKQRQTLDWMFYKDALGTEISRSLFFFSGLLRKTHFPLFKTDLCKTTSTLLCVRAVLQNANLTFAV